MLDSPWTQMRAPRFRWSWACFLIPAALLSAAIPAPGSAQGLDAGCRLHDAPGEALAVLRGTREPVAPQPLVVVPVLKSLAEAVSTDSLLATLTRLTSHATRYTSTSEYAATAVEMGERFAGLGLDDVYLHDFTCCGGTHQNVVGIKLGAVYPDEIVIVGGHLDSISQSPQTNAPGAEDNGTGSSAVTELARLLAPVETERTIHFVLFGGEEQGLHGSRAYAAMAAGEGWDVPAVVTFDMVGYYDPASADLWVEGFVTGENSQWLVQLVRQHAETYGELSVYVYPNNGFGSDHVPFHDYGFPSMLSIENEWDSYPCYHRTCDTMEWVSGDLLRAITAGNGTAILDLAGPLFTPASISGHVDLLEKDDESGATLTLAGTGYDPEVTGPSGAYELLNLLPGTYTLRAESEGYLAQIVEVTLVSGEQATIDLVMVPAASGVPVPAASELRGPLLGAFVSPNPFGDETSVSFTLNASASVRARIFDAEGRLRRSLADREERGLGLHRLSWDGRDDEGRPTPSGVYFLEMRVLPTSGSRERVIATEQVERLPLRRIR